MPVATITPSIDIEALTLIGIKAAQEERDALKVAPGVMGAYEMVLGKTPKRWPSESDRWMAEIQVVEHSAVTNFQTGFESYDSSALTVGRPIAFALAISGIAAKLGERQFRIYGTGNRLGEQVKKLSKNCVGILYRGWCRRVVAATGAGFADFSTYNGFDSTAGFFESPAKASQINTVGGFNKGTWAPVAGATNAVADLGNAFGTNFFQAYAGLTSVETVKPVASGKKFGLMSSSFRNNIKRYLQAYERWGARDEIDGGKVVEVFQGIKFYLDTFMPNAGATTTTNPISAYVVDAEDVFPVWAPALRLGEVELPDGYFGQGDWRPLSGLQNVYVMPFACAGNMVAELFGSSLVIRRGETY